MAGSPSLNDRQYQAFRRVRPGRQISEADGSRHAEQYATAVSDADGNPVIADVPTLLRELILETRRTNLFLQMLTGQEVVLADVV